MSVWRHLVLVILCFGLGVGSGLLGCGDAYEETCTDADGDGFFSQGGCGTVVDCNDEDADVNAAVTEGAFGGAACSDEIDNDCDGLTDGQDSGCQACVGDGDCDDGNACTNDACLDGGCVYTNNTNACDDGNPCTEGDTCSGGACVGTGRDADDDGFMDDACGGSDCDDSDGNMNPGVTEGPAGDATCSDGADNDCDDLTDGQDSGCQGCAVDEACNDGNPCTDDACVYGTCVNTNNTNACDDGNACTEGDTCSGGTCVGTGRDTDDDGFVDDACGGSDCDDADGDVNPGATEGPEGDATCSDQIDNDCNGLVDGSDEGCGGLGADLPVGSCNPLSVARLESPASFTLFTNGYQSFFDRTSEVILLNDENKMALWIYDARDVGGLIFAHSAELSGNEMIISDTEHDRVIIAEATNDIYNSDPGFQVVWNSDDDTDLSLDYPNDANFLPNGNLLITDRDNHRVIEVNRNTGEIEWQFGRTGQPGSDDEHLNGPHNADRLSDGNTIVSDSENSRILEIDSLGEVVWLYHPSGGDRLRWPRDADVLDNGNVLITDSANGRVIEVNRAGEVVWEYGISILGTLTEPYEADRLDNGNILITSPGINVGAIYEVAYSTKQLVWQFP